MKDRYWSKRKESQNIFEKTERGKLISTTKTRKLLYIVEYYKQNEWGVRGDENDENNSFHIDK
jgi:uncharacterized protein YqeY